MVSLDVRARKRRTGCRPALSGDVQRAVVAQTAIKLTCLCPAPTVRAPEAGRGLHKNDLSRFIMYPLLHDLARHAGQLSLSLLFMLMLTVVLYSETHISKMVAGALASIWPS